jgi:SPP1 family predicted phage head-tail adaptor
MIDPGRLNRRLVLEAPVETPDGAGGVTRAYSEIATIWADVTPVAARGGIDAASGGATVTHRIRVRAGPAITTQHRLRLDTRVFRIVSVRAHDRAERFLDIHAEERVD